MIIHAETIRVAVQELRRNFMRSLLTTLGIIIGVSAVITTVALGEGAQRAVQERIEAMGTDLLTVYPGQFRRHGVGRGGANLTVDDAPALERSSAAVLETVPEITGSLQVEYGNRNANVTVTATTANFARVNNFKIQSGKFFDPSDLQARRRVAVIGSAIPTTLGVPAARLLGAQIRIRGISFDVIGVLEEKGAQGWSNEDEQVIVPLSTGQYRVFGTDLVRRIGVRLAPDADMEIAMLEIERTLRREHRLRPEAENDFSVFSRTELIGTLEETTQTFTFLVAGIAAVSLLVGGIGIMNIMLVSVTERTSEIGVRKAIGARRRDILSQFLVEAVAICVLGGLLGILVGSGGAVILSRFADWNTVLSPRAVLLAILFSTGVGLFFGIYPARRAAAMDPIAALRHE
ncbi:MAG: ABC transporter permease [Candidatus Eisenbacteria bacterium]|nr:ABC transporter permease [Candidatus Eisenbacteria bacterium]